MIRLAEQTGCDQPTVSVAVITYNHEQFIAQAIEVCSCRRRNLWLNW